MKTFKDTTIRKFWDTSKSFWPCLHNYLHKLKTKRHRYESISYHRCSCCYRCNHHGHAP